MAHPEGGDDQEERSLSDGMEVRQAVHQPVKADRILQSQLCLSSSKIVVDEIQVSSDECPQLVVHSFLQFVKSWKVLSAGRAGAGELVLGSEPLLSLLSWCL